MSCVSGVEVGVFVGAGVCVDVGFANCGESGVAVAVTVGTTVAICAHAPFAQTKSTILLVRPLE